MTPVSAGLPRILTIEDDLVLGAYVHEHLGRCGFQVTWCQNGQEGLSIARRQPFDVVLMDINLPGMLGTECVRRLKIVAPDVPVLMLTAKGAGREREAAERAGVSRFMTKPFSNADILASVRALAGR